MGDQGLAAGDDEVLADGWEPDGPSGDTLLRAALDNTVHELLHPAQAMGGRFEVHDDVALVDLGSPTPFLNGAVLRRPLHGWSADPVLDQVDEFFAGSPGPAVVYSPTPTPDLRERGWQRVGHPPLMVRPAGGTPPPSPPDFTFRSVQDEADLDHACRLIVEGYPVPELQPWRHGSPFDERVLGDDAFRFYLGCEGGHPVCVAAAVVDGVVNGVHYVANDPEARGKGYGEAIVWAATLADPTKPAVLISSDLGRSTYERMGYLTVTRWSLWLVGVRPASAR
jgi:GNAT superfamily N-acetyltransferase